MSDTDVNLDKVLDTYLKIQETIESKKTNKILEHILIIIIAMIALYVIIMNIRIMNEFQTLAHDYQDKLKETENIYKHGFENLAEALKNKTEIPIVFQPKKCRLF